MNRDHLTQIAIQRPVAVFIQKPSPDDNFSEWAFNRDQRSVCETNPPTKWRSRAAAGEHQDIVHVTQNIVKKKREVRVVHRRIRDVHRNIEFRLFEITEAFRRIYPGRYWQCHAPQVLTNLLGPTPQLAGQLNDGPTL